MKVKAIVVGILAVVLVAYAWRFPVGAYKYYTDIREFRWVRMPARQYLKCTGDTLKSFPGCFW